MIYIGCHLSVADGYAAMGETMRRYGGNTFAWFTRNPRGGKTRAAEPGDLQALASCCRREQFGPLVAHGSYTMNLCSANPQTRANAREMLAADLDRMEMLPGNLYNFHPGAHTGQGTEAGIEEIAEGLRQALRAGRQTVVLLETMAGKGSEIGGTFEELRAILDRTESAGHLGICLDTCHVWDAGYDLRENPDHVLTEFDRIIGLSRLRAIHLNDSRNDRGSHKDRHEKLGQGYLGEEALKRIVRHPALQGLPFILETPNEEEGYIREIRMVQEWMEA